MNGRMETWYLHEAVLRRRRRGWESCRKGMYGQIGSGE